MRSNPALEIEPDPWNWVRGEGLGFTFHMSTMVLLFLVPNSLPTDVSVYLDPHGHPSAALGSSLKFP